MNKSFADNLHLHFIIFLTGFTGIMGKIIMLDALNLVFWRLAFTVIGLYILVSYRRRAVGFDIKRFVKLSIPGVFIGLHFFTFYLSIQSSTVSIGLATFAGTSVFTAFIEPLLYKRRVYIWEIAYGIIVLLCMLSIFGFEYGYRFGVIVGVLSALCYAVFTVLNGKLANTGGATENMMYETLAALLVITLCNLISPAGFTPLSEITVSDWLWLLFLSVVCTLYAYTAILYLLKTLTPFHISLGTNLEPIYGIVLALLIFGEREILSLPFYIAAGVMLSTVISYPLIKSRLSSKKTDKIAA